MVRGRFHRQRMWFVVDYTDSECSSYKNPLPITILSQIPIPILLIPHLQFVYKTIIYITLKRKQMNDIQINCVF